MDHITKQAAQKVKYPKKEFGELKLKGGLNDFQQLLRLKYLYPTEKYPQGKAVIEMLVPDNIHSISLDKDDIRDAEFKIERLAKIIEKVDDTEDKQVLASEIRFLKDLQEKSKDIRKQSFVVRSFRFTEKDYVETQALMSYMAKLFGYLFYKYKHDVEKENKPDFMAKSRNVIANTMSEKVYKNFINGFMEGVNEDG